MSCRKEGLIDVVVPAYNVEEYIDDCVKSIIGQTYKNIHLILINNGSDDNTIDKCYEYARKDNRIEVIDIPKSPTNNAVLIGIENCIGDYCVFVDSDDWLDDDLIEHLEGMIGDADGIKCGLKSVWPDRIELLGKSCARVYDCEQINEIIKRFFDETGSITDSWSNSRCGKLYKTDILKECIDLCDKRLYIGEDLLLNLTYLSKCNSIIVIDDYFGYNIRRREGSITANFFKDIPKYNADFIENLYEYAHRFGYSEKYIGYIKRDLYLSSVLLSLRKISIKNLLYMRVFWREYIFRLQPCNKPYYYGNIKIFGVVLIYPLIITGVEFMRQFRRVLKWKKN